jgi:hypothetical protein
VLSLGASPSSEALRQAAGSGTDVIEAFLAFPLALPLTALALPSLLERVRHCGWLVMQPSPRALARRHTFRDREEAHGGGGHHHWRVLSRLACQLGTAAGWWARVRPREAPAPSPTGVALHAARRLRPPPGTRAVHRTPDCVPHPFPNSRGAGAHQRARARVAAKRCLSPAPAARGSHPDRTDTNERLGHTAGARPWQTP